MLVKCLQAAVSPAFYKQQLTRSDATNAAIIPAAIKIPSGVSTAQEPQEMPSLVNKSAASTKMPKLKLSTEPRKPAYEIPPGKGKFKAKYDNYDIMKFRWKYVRPQTLELVPDENSLNIQKEKSENDYEVSYV